MTKQVKLTEKQRQRAEDAANAICDMCGWHKTSEGTEYWNGIYRTLLAKAEHGTSDGKPWVEPVPEPQVMRTTPDAVKESKTAGNIAFDALQEIAIKAIDANIVCDALNEVAIIDDQWAAVWPRRLVMARYSDDDPWQGPYRLGSVDSDEWPFSMVDDSRYKFCRPCTAAEIAAYEGKKDQPAGPTTPEIGEGYRKAYEADKSRLDRQYWKDDWGWLYVQPGSFFPWLHYRVPVDRIPTDADALGRPVVMVRDVFLAQDWDNNSWRPARLIEVDETSYPFKIRLENNNQSQWVAQCRFPYPGEVETPHENAD